MIAGHVETGRDVGTAITEATAQQATVTMQRDGHVWVGDVHCPMRVSKTFTFT